MERRLPVEKRPIERSLVAELMQPQREINIEAIVKVEPEIAPYEDEP